MAIAPCSACGTRFLGRAVTIYWAWYPPEAERVCYRDRTCPGCAVDALSSLAIALHEHQSELGVCPFCGTTYDDGIAALYVTIYLPGEDPKRMELPSCPNCRTAIVAPVMDRADLQPSRPGFGPPNAAGPQRSRGEDRLDSLRSLLGGP